MPAMRLFTCFLQLLAGLALPAVPPQQLALSAGNSSSEMEVVPFQEVWGRSYCRTLERLVDIMSEYPSEVEHMFSPSCVSLLRCTGCCGDENLHCVPVEMANVTMQLLKIRSGYRPSYVELTFSQHVRCECSHSSGGRVRTCRVNARLGLSPLTPRLSHSSCFACGITRPQRGGGSCVLTSSLSWQQPSSGPWPCPSFTVLKETLSARTNPPRSKGRKPMREKMKPERCGDTVPRR
uniref:Placental growth factor n=1 Tax=Rousettus aegyptiacus TaxID=9407 RepID=A0A7J8IPF2_ROUAE|nr:placental growth factor [Rousettus aegyptiacus]